MFPLLLVLALQAQVVPDASRPAADCAISGTVVNANTGEPIAGAMVMLGGPRGAGAGSATDAAGRWSISNTACAPVRPTATRTGFFTGSYTGSYTGDQPEAGTVQLGAGSPARDLKIALVPEGSIAGRVQDANGDPIAQAYVDVMRASVKNGKRTMVGVGDQHTRTDGHGDFWIGGLRPGRYIVCASSSGLTYPVGGGGAHVYVEDCFPGPPSAGASIAMSIRGTEVRASLTLRTTPGLHVRGKVSGPRPLTNLDVELAKWPGDPARDQTWDGDPHLMTYNGASVDREGNFDVAALQSGSWRVEALLPASQAGGDVLFAETRIEVGSADVDDVRLALTPLGSINGTVRLDASATAVDIEVGLAVPETGFLFTPDAQWDSRHVTFVMPLVLPGQYLLNASVAAGGAAWVKSATLKGRNVLTQPIAVDGATGSIDIVVTDETSDVNATVTDADGNPAAAQVILIAGAGQPIMMRAGKDGHATKHGLPGGEYKAWAFDDISNVPWAEDDWLAQNAGPAQKFTITTGSTATVTLTRTNVPPE